jgi:hypothetical protein
VADELKVCDVSEVKKCEAAARDSAKSLILSITGCGLLGKTKDGKCADPQAEVDADAAAAATEPARKAIRRRTRTPSRRRRRRRHPHRPNPNRRFESTHSRRNWRSPARRSSRRSSRSSNRSN